jgi:hypothetical protein
MLAQTKLIMLLLNVVLLVLLNLDYNPFNYTFLNNVVLMVLAITFIKSYDFVMEDKDI